MTKSEFMSRLRRGLSGLPATTIADIVADHEAHFADAVAEGRSEAEAAAALGGRAIPFEEAEAALRTTDIVIAAAGAPSIVTPDMVRPGAAVVSAGITFGEGRRLIPDVDEACAEVAGWITPRLGGVGPTTRAMLLANAVAAAERGAA